MHLRHLDRNQENDEEIILENFKTITEDWGKGLMPTKLINNIF